MPDQGDKYRCQGWGGQLLVEQLKAAGVCFVFANPGSVEVGFYDALVDTPELALIMGLHEGIVVSMADGYHKVTGRPAFANVHVIVGTGQMLGQLYNLARDGSAVVVSAGLKDNERLTDDVVLAPLAGFSQREIVRSLVKGAWEVRDPGSIPVVTRRAFKVATTPPTGPTYLAYADYALEAQGLKADIYPQERFKIGGRMQPDPVLVAQAAEKLLAADKPVMVVGDEVWRSEAQTEAVALAERLAIPVAVGRQAYQNFPNQHPLYLGRYNRVDFPPGGGDLFLGVGARTAGYGRIPGDAQTIREPTTVMIGINPDHMGRNHPLDVAIVADVRETLRALLDALDGLITPNQIGPKVADRFKRIAAFTEAGKQKRRAALERHFSDVPICPERLGYELDQVLNPHAILVSENFTGHYDLMHLGFREDEKMWLFTSGASLGWGIGGAIGAKLGCPDRQVVLSIGDGSVMYSASGFWTMARYQIPILTVVWNNLNYQTVRWMFHGYGGRAAAKDQYPGIYLGDPQIDFVGLAKSQGVEGQRVTEPDQLRPALEKGCAAVAQGQPYLVDVIIARLGGGSASTWHHGFRLAGTKNPDSCFGIVRQPAGR